MSGYALLAPIPNIHLDDAIEILQTKEFVLFGSEAYGVFEKTEIGTKLLVYVFHDDAEPVVRYRGTYAGLVGDVQEMRELEKEGYRPPSTAGEKWAFYWKVSELIKLDDLIPLSVVQLPSGAHLKGLPRGPMHIVN